SKLSRHFGLFFPCCWRLRPSIIFSIGSVLRSPTDSDRVSTHLKTLKKLSFFRNAFPAMHPPSPSFSMNSLNLDRKYGLEKKFLCFFLRCSKCSETPPW